MPPVPARLFSLILILLSGVFFNHCTDHTADGVKIVAHRGAMNERPENTLSAFERAVELGAHLVEIDVRTSRDGHLFILHDQRLERTTDGEGVASELTLEELKHLDAGSWFDPVYADQTIPSFREVMEWAAGSGTVLLLDLKESGREFAENVANGVRQANMEDKVVIGVRSTGQAREFSELLPGSRMLAFMRSPDDIEDYAASGVHIIRLWLRWLEEDPSLAERVRQTDRKLMINGTTGGPEEAQVIMRFQPDLILIDDAVRLMQSLEELQVNIARK